MFWENITSKVQYTILGISKHQTIACCQQMKSKIYEHWWVKVGYVRINVSDSYIMDTKGLKSRDIWEIKTMKIKWLLKASSRFSQIGEN
jgi:hypothetical protein